LRRARDRTDRGNDQNAAQSRGPKNHPAISADIPWHENDPSKSATRFSPRPSAWFREAANPTLDIIRWFLIEQTQIQVVVGCSRFVARVGLSIRGGMVISFICRDSVIEWSTNCILKEF
jgi:hypothetical protein